MFGCAGIGVDGLADGKAANLYLDPVAEDHAEFPSDRHKHLLPLRVKHGLEAAAFSARHRHPLLVNYAGNVIHRQPLTDTTGGSDRKANLTEPL